MAIIKNQTNKVTFVLKDSSGAILTGKTVTTYLSKDGAAFAAPAGAVTELSRGAYVFSGTAADWNADYYALCFTASGAVDTFLHGSTDNTLNSFLAQADFKKLLATANGGFTFTPPTSYPGTGTLVLKDSAGTTLQTFTVSFDANKVPIGRV